MARPRAPRRLSERLGRFLLNLYPPFFFQRIRLVHIAEGFRRIDVRISPSVLTRNLNGTIFGGTIYSAADPIYVLMFWQVFAHRGVAVRAWLKRGAVRYLAPASSRLTLSFEIGDDELARAEAAIAAGERFAETFVTRAVDAGGTVCAEISTEVVLRPR